MHRFLGFPRPPHGRTHRFLAVGMTVTCRLHHCYPLEAGDAANIVQKQAEYVAEAWRRGEEEGFETVHQLAAAQTDLATVRDAMEATDEAVARKEQEAADMVDGEM